MKAISLTSLLSILILVNSAQAEDFPTAKSAEVAFPTAKSNLKDLTEAAPTPKKVAKVEVAPTPKKPTTKAVVKPSQVIDLDHTCNNCGTYVNMINRKSGNMHSHFCPKCKNEWWHPNPGESIPKPRLVENKIKWLTDYDVAYSESIKNNKPLLILFTDPTGACIPCLQLEKTTLSNSEVIKLLNDTFVCFRVEINEPYGKILVSRFNITSWPSMVICKAGKITNSKSGKLSKDEMIIFLESRATTNTSNNIILKNEVTDCPT